MVEARKLEVGSYGQGTGTVPLVTGEVYSAFSLLWDRELADFAKHD